MGTATQGPLKDSAVRARVLEERRALLNRVLWSRQIEKSARIRDLISYLCERALKEPAVEIHEQEIGVRVFGRAPDYDTAVDNLVRVTASQTRKKLEQYFASDGAGEPVILEIPRGGYTPVFRERIAPSAASAKMHAEKQPEQSTPRLKAAFLVPVLSVCTVLFAIASLVLALRLWNAPGSGTELDTSPALRSLWTQMLPRSDASRTNVVLPDSSLSLFQELLNRPLTLSEYLNPGTWQNAGDFSSNRQLKEFAQRAAQRRFTSLASVTAVYRIGQLAGRDRSRLSFVSARDFNMRQIKSDNVVLLGSTRANPWMELIQDRLNYRFGFDQTSRFSYFENRNPRPGELKIYRTDSAVSYCQIAFLPNLGRSGNVLAVAGTEVEGTEGGSEFVTTEGSLVQLRQAMHAAKDATLPYFEALLKSSRAGGATPGFTIVAVRLLQP